jgi:hypothetical protein
METAPGPSLTRFLVAEGSGPVIVLTYHARLQMIRRGATEDVVLLAVSIGQREPARRGLFLCRLDVPFGGVWRGRRYTTMQVAPVIAVQPGRVVVVTVYTFYFPPEP